MSDPEHHKEETPYGRAYRRASETYHQYTERWWATIQSINHHYRTKREQYGGWEQEKKVLEVSAVILILVYTAIQGCQLSVIRDQERRQLRAYVGIATKPFAEGNPFLPPAVPEIDFDMRNSGLTPAYHVIHRSAAALLSYPLPQGFGFSIPTPTDTLPEPITIFPGTLDNLGIMIRARRSLTPEEFSSIADGRTKRVYLWGTIYYGDAFDSQHFTNFCFGYFGTDKKIWHEPCEKHNDAD